MDNELFLEQKKYISAKRGAEITGYTADYIGQLCRANKLDCKQVGRVWFVAENSIVEHQKLANQKTRGIINFPPVLEIGKAVDCGNTEVDLGNIELGKSSYHLSTIFSTVFSPQFQAFFFGLFLVVLTGFISGFVLFSQNKQAQIHIAELSQGVIEKTHNVAHNFFVRSDLDTAHQSANIFSLSSFSQNTKNKIISFKYFFNRLAFGVYYTISSLFNTDRMNVVVVRDGVHLDAIMEEKDRSGLIVFPATGNENNDERLKQNIKNSFSDQTEVFPDETGSSGVIKPVFKKSTDQEYLYVMVPIDK